MSIRPCTCPKTERHPCTCAPRRLDHHFEINDLTINVYTNGDLSVSPCNGDGPTLDIPFTTLQILDYAIHSMRDAGLHYYINRFNVDRRLSERL